MSSRSNNQRQLTNIIKTISDFSFGLRNRLLVRVYRYFQKNKLPMDDLLEIAEMSKQSMYEIVSKENKKNAGKHQSHVRKDAEMGVSR